MNPWAQSTLALHPRGDLLLRSVCLPQRLLTLLTARDALILPPFLFCAVSTLSSSSSRSRCEEWKQRLFAAVAGSRTVAVTADVAGDEQEQETDTDDRNSGSSFPRAWKEAIELDTTEDPSDGESLVACLWALWEMAAWASQGIVCVAIDHVRPWDVPWATDSVFRFDHISVGDVLLALFSSQEVCSYVEDVIEEHHQEASVVLSLLRRSTDDVSESVPSGKPVSLRILGYGSSVSVILVEDTLEHFETDPLAIQVVEEVSVVCARKVHEVFSLSAELENRIESQKYVIECDFFLHYFEEEPNLACPNNTDIQEMRSDEPSVIQFARFDVKWVRPPVWKELEYFPDSCEDSERNSGSVFGRVSPLLPTLIFLYDTEDNERTDGPSSILPSARMFQGMPLELLSGCPDITSLSSSGVDRGSMCLADLLESAYHRQCDDDDRESEDEC